MLPLFRLIARFIGYPVVDTVKLRVCWFLRIKIVKLRLQTCVKKCKFLLKFYSQRENVAIFCLIARFSGYAVVKTVNL